MGLRPARRRGRSLHTAFAVVHLRGGKGNRPPSSKYYRTTGYPPRLDLAIMLKEKCLDGYFTQDGSYDPSLSAPTPTR